MRPPSKLSGKHLFQDETPEIPDLIIKLQAQGKEKHISKKKILKDIRNVRKQLYSNSFGDE
jgi:hypothetical protein